MRNHTPVLSLKLELMMQKGQLLTKYTYNKQHNVITNTLPSSETAFCVHPTSLWMIPPAVICLSLRAAQHRASQLMLIC
jgi:hypothetical protein